MKIGNVILNLLDEHNMSQRELAQRLQIAPTTLNGYIKNKHEPDCTTLVSIAQLFHVSVDYLLSYTAPSDMQDKQLLRDFYSLSKEQREIVTELITVMQRQNQRKK